MSDVAGFSMLNQPLTLNCNAASYALLDANRFASRTTFGFGSSPWGFASERSFLTAAKRSLRFALLKVLQGGAKCNHLTLLVLKSFFNCLKGSVLIKSNVFSFRPFACISYACNTATSALITAFVNPASPAKNGEMSCHSARYHQICLDAFVWCV